MDKCRAKIEAYTKQIDKISNVNKFASTGKLKNETGPIKADLKKEKELLYRLEIIREEKIPFYEKLPKDSVFYKHYMSNMYVAKIKESANTA